MLGVQELLVHPCCGISQELPLRANSSAHLEVGESIFITVVGAHMGWYRRGRVTISPLHS